MKLEWRTAYVFLGGEIHCLNDSAGAATMLGCFSAFMFGVAFFASRLMQIINEPDSVRLLCGLACAFSFTGAFLGFSAVILFHTRTNYLRWIVSQHRVVEGDE